MPLPRPVPLGGRVVGAVALATGQRLGYEHSRPSTPYGVGVREVAERWVSELPTRDRAVGRRAAAHLAAEDVAESLRGVVEDRERSLGSRRRELSMVARAARHLAAADLIAASDLVRVLEIQRSPLPPQQPLELPAVLQVPGAAAHSQPRRASAAAVARALRGRGWPLRQIAALEWADMPTPSNAAEEEVWRWHREATPGRYALPALGRDGRARQPERPISVSALHRLLQHSSS